MEISRAPMEGAQARGAPGDALSLTAGELSVIGVGVLWQRHAQAVGGALPACLPRSWRKLPGKGS